MRLCVRVETITVAEKQRSTKRTGVLTARTPSRFRPTTYNAPTKEKTKVGVVVVVIVIMANVAPVGEDLSDADDVNEVGVRVDSPLSSSSSSARNRPLLRASPPSCPVFRRAHWRHVATRRDSRRDRAPPET